MGREHRAPWGCRFPKEEEGVCKPGIPPEIDSEYFEILCLCVLQAGLNWRYIRDKWREIRKSFYGFNPKILSKISVEELLEKALIKNRRKVEAIIDNARRFLEIQRKYGSFRSYIEELIKIEDQEAIEVIAKQFSHIGEYSAEYFLHSVGYWILKNSAK